jgi:hypothetical protein
MPTSLRPAHLAALLLLPLQAFVANGASAQLLFYNGEPNGQNAATSGRLLANGTTYTVYDNFSISGATWSVDSIFGNYFIPVPPQFQVPISIGDFEIRDLAPSDSASAILFSGTSLFGTWAPTGSSYFGYAAYRFTLTNLSMTLGPGSYWLGLRPASATQTTLLLDTFGAYGIGEMIDASSVFVSRTGQASALRRDFSFGIGGTSQEVVPEPATMGLVATGLAGIAAARRKVRKA